mmetsp:Transcript_41765/g.135094  ORF Transcript_41765/g.135094 Transcript_41765/m.135094 type:complete len:334 (+) Transcript_41765:1412-2413(+)
MVPKAIPLHHALVCRMVIIAVGVPLARRSAGHLPAGLCATLDFSSKCDVQLTRGPSLPRIQQVGDSLGEHPALRPDDLFASPATLLFLCTRVTQMRNNASQIHAELSQGCLGRIYASLEHLKVHLFAHLWDLRLVSFDERLRSTHIQCFATHAIGCADGKATEGVQRDGGQETKLLETSGSNGNSPITVTMKLHAWARCCDLLPLRQLFEDPLPLSGCPNISASLSGHDKQSSAIHRVGIHSTNNTLLATALVELLLQMLDALPTDRCSAKQGQLQSRSSLHETTCAPLHLRLIDDVAVREQESDLASARLVQQGLPEKAAQHALRDVVAHCP